MKEKKERKRRYQFAFPVKEIEGVEEGIAGFEGRGGRATIAHLVGTEHGRQTRHI